MKEIYLLNNYWFLKEILKIDDIYDKYKYDDSPSLEEFKPEGLWFLLITEDRHSAGVINVTQINNVLWNCHVTIFEEFRGPGSEEWAQLVARYMKDQFGAAKFLAITPYKAAKDYAKRAGFKYVTTLEKSILKGGDLLDQYVLELDASSVGEQ